MNNLDSVEQMVLDKLLEGRDIGLDVLRQQAGQMSVASREMTGVGFFTHFVVPLEAPRLEKPGTYKFGDVTGETKSLQNGVGFLLTVKNGVIAELEGYTYDEPWPAVLGDIELNYNNPYSRDLGELFPPE